MKNSQSNYCSTNTQLPQLNTLQISNFCTRKKAQIKYNINQENDTRIDYDYNVGNQVMLKNDQANKYETL